MNVKKIIKKMNKKRKKIKKEKNFRERSKKGRDLERERDELLR
jgi:hypothetical protein